MWFLATRDIVLFLVGLALLAKELVSKSPDPIIVEVAAGLVGTPAALHHRIIRRSTGSTSEPIQQPLPSDVQSTDSSN